MTDSIVSKPDLGSAVTEDRDGQPLQIAAVFQTFFDDIEEKLNTNLLGDVVQLSTYTVAGVPDATSFTGAMIFVTDEIGGSVPAFTDGTDWRRVTDRAIIS